MTSVARSARSFLVALGLLACSLPAVAEPEPGCPFAPWQRLPETGRELVRPLPIVFLAVGAALPVAFAPTGVDHELRVTSQEDLGGSYNLEPVSVAAPYVLAGAVFVGYGVSVVAQACEWQRYQAGMLQAMALTFGTISLLKWSVGRGFPNAGQDPNDPERLSHAEYAVRFDPYQADLGAWPSGHVGVAFAAAASLRGSARELGLLRFAGYPIAAGIAAGMWFGDHHWASDILSGALIGEAIGSSAGRAFAQDEKAEGLAWLFAPWPGGAVAAVGGAF